MSQIQPRIHVVAFTIHCLTPGAHQERIHDSLPDTRTRLLRERVGTHLELHHLARRPLPVSMWNGVLVDIVVQMPRPFHPALGSSMTAVHPLRVEPNRIRHAHGDELAVFQRQQCFGRVPGVDRHVAPQSQRVELIDPRVVAPFRASESVTFLNCGAGSV